MGRQIVDSDLQCDELTDDSHFEIGKEYLHRSRPNRS